jgi:hypothetical protein
MPGFVRSRVLFVPGETVFGRTGGANLSAICPANVRQMSGICPLLSGRSWVLFAPFGRRPTHFGIQARVLENVSGIVGYCRLPVGVGHRLAFCGGPWAILGKLILHFVQDDKHGW